MSQLTKLFINGRSRAVRLPAAYHFDTKEVFSAVIRKRAMLSCRLRPLIGIAFLRH